MLIWVSGRGEISKEKKPENLRKINVNDNKDLKQSKILDNALVRENFQRNYVQNELKKIDEEDLILVNDLDEIPNLEKFVYKTTSIVIIFYYVVKGFSFLNPKYD